MSDLPLSLDFRSELFVPLTAQLRAGESAALLGVGSCGKSNVVRFLKRADAREFYFQEQAAATLYTPVDCYKMPDTAEVTVYAAMLAALAETAPTLGEEGAKLAPQFDAWWNEIIATNRAPIAQRRVAEALAALLNGPAKRVILLFDDCDELIAHAQPALFRNLRALRDDHKYRLVYITVTRRELARLRDMSPDYESFFELLARHQFALQPYQRDDANFMLKRLVARNAGTRPFTDAELQNVYRLTGGHAGLVGVTFELVKNTERASTPDLLDFLADKRVVYQESQKIWDSLEDYEHADLLALVQHQEPPGDGLPPLLKKGIVKKNERGGLEIFAELFERFVEEQLEQDTAGEDDTSNVNTPPLRITHDALGGVVRVNARTVLLSPVESELFGYLFAHCERACDANELVNVLMTVDYGGNPYGRLHMHLTRMQERLNRDGEHVLSALADSLWQVNCGEAHEEKN